MDMKMMVIQEFIDLMNILIFNNKKRVKIIFTLLIPVVLATRCVREETIDEFRLNFEKKPVVICILAPGKEVQLLLYNSTSIEDSLKSIKDLGIYDANIYLSNKNRKVKLINTNKELPLYISKDFQINKGYKYYLEIKLKDGKVVSSNTSIPEDPVLFKNMEIINQYEVKKPIRNNRYEIVGYEIEEFLDVRIEWEKQTPFLLIKEKYFYEDNDIKQDLDSYFLLDNKVMIKSGNQNILPVYYLITPNNDLNQYFEIYKIQYENKEASDYESFLDIFRGVLPEYTNINGGIGIFGGYLIDSVYVNK